MHSGKRHIVGPPISLDILKTVLDKKKFALMMILKKIKITTPNPFFLHVQMHVPSSHRHKPNANLNCRSSTSQISHSRLHFRTLLKVKPQPKKFPKIGEKRRKKKKNPMSAGDLTGGALKPVCTICFDDLKPITEDLQSIPICGHVFHELW